MNLIQCWIEHPILKLNQTFSYVSAQDDIVPGTRVLVDFNHQEIIGFVDSVESYQSLEEIENKVGTKCKSIISVLDDECLLTEELIALAKWMAMDTISPTISCFKAMLPSKIKPSSNHQKILYERWVRLSDNEVELTAKQSIAYQHLIENKECLYSKYVELFKTIPKALVDKGAIEIFEKEKTAKLEDVEIVQGHCLSKAQSDAMEKILNTDKQTILLHGVTGSGKTEIYLQLAQKIREENKQVLFLVPEISLTPQMISRVKSRFGSSVAIYHSGLNNQEKYEQYRLVKKNEVSMVVGTRSAVFMPFHNLGLIILDEEHDSSYKQDSTPQYHCRDLAIHRGTSFHCKVVLGSATPSLESYARAVKGVYELVELDERINQTLPTIECINLKDSIRSGKSYILSEQLKFELENCLKNNHQAILLLNRRGYNTSLRCKNCQDVLMCKHCDVAMSYHADTKNLKCHTCGATSSIPRICPSCNHQDGFASFGFGTQRLEEEIKNMFPEARCIRMDADTTSKKNSHENLLKRFENHECDILIGTQMIAKGLDYPNVTLVGVLNADSGLNRSDYRSVETTYDLIVQASGRSGRSIHPGKVLLQVFDEKHYAIQTAIHHDYKKFFLQEMQFRKAGGYPPYNYLIAILVQDKDLAHARKVAMSLKEKMQGEFKILGPSELTKIKDYSRIRILLKGKDIELLKRITANAVNATMKESGRAVIKVDVNPLVLD